MLNESKRGAGTHRQRKCVIMRSESDKQTFRDGCAIELVRDGATIPMSPEVCGMTKSRDQVRFMAASGSNRASES